MKTRKTLCLLLALMLLGLGGCGEAEEAPRVLTALSTYEHPYAGLTPWVEDFNRTHPETEIQLEYGVDLQASDAEWEAYRTRWTTELMSGQAADILLDEGYLNPAQYEQSGLMYDLYEWMDKDPDFHREDYFQNLFAAFETHGHLYTLPVAFQFEVVYLNDALLQASGLELAPWDAISYKDILEIYRRADGLGLLAEGFTLEYQDMVPKAYLFLDTELVDYVSLEDREASFDSPGFIEYLTETKAIPGRKKCSDGITLAGGEARYMMEEFSKSNAEGNTSLMMDITVSLDGRADHMDELIEGCAGPFLLCSEGGSRSFYPELKLAVPKNCRNPELAWEFLKFLISPAQTPAYGQRWNPEGSVDLCKTFVPVGRDNFRTFARLYSQGANHVRETQGAAWEEGFDLTAAPCPLTDELLDRLEAAIEGITKTKDRFGPLEDLLRPTLEEYYDTEVLTAPQCARRLQEIAELYLNE